jgi:uncharacterized protein (TIGR03086 family)
MADRYKTDWRRWRHDRDMTAIAERISHLSDRFESLIANVEPGAWSNQSPCDEWTARDVVRHVVDVHQMMLKPLERTLSPAPSVDDDPLGAFRAARADVAGVLDDPNLAKTEYDGYFGRAVVEQTIDGFLGFDLVVHGWDLATATGQELTIEQVEIARIRTQVDGLGEALRSPGVCKDPVEVPDDASEQDKLLAFLGRRPR